ncbi:MAG TPA: hypothetical protein VK457_13570 [Chloroflexota bacterium]|jgi:hypothetical protein|nr:hypothetical protein [Chloroflexota bacterium]
MIYFLTLLNAVILGIVAYLFYAFRKAVDSSGVRQIDDYLHELEGSVAQLTEQFERTSTKISKDLLRKTTELQALIGECDTKLAEASRLRAGAPVTAAEVLAGRRGPAATPRSTAGPEGVRPPVTGVPTVPPAVAARRLSASEALASSPSPAGANPAPPAPTSAGDRTPTQAEQAPAPVAVSDLTMEPVTETEPVSAEAEPQPVAAAVGQPNEKYRLIFLLASEGMDTASIAKHTNLTRGEVEMLLDLRRQGKI